MPHAKTVYQLLIEQAHLQPLAVFDLDSTLYNVSIRTQKIIEHFSEELEYRRAYPREVAFLKDIKIHHREWGLKESLERAGLISTEAFYRALRNYWKKHFFSSHYLQYDVPYKGALEYVQGLCNAGVRIKYLTARDEKNMLDGTIESLNRYGFPLGDVATDLFMKPIKGQQEDEDFKTEKFKDLLTYSNNIWFFENEPVIVRKVSEIYPAIKIIWIDTTHSRREQPPKGIYTIEDHWHKE